MALSQLLAIFAALLVVESQARPISNFNGTLTKFTTQDDSWDHYVFAQQYPAGVCYIDDTKGNSCGCPNNATSWTIHGLWPTYGETRGPTSCNDQLKFDENNIQDLVARLVMEWTNLMPETDFYSFWSHEWLKHGTCSGMTTVNQYFSTVLKIFEGGLNFGDVLQKGGITPSSSNTYTVQQFEDAFSQQFGQGVVPKLQCYYAKNMGQVLKQMSICLDKDFKPIVCPGSSSSDSGSCGDFLYVPFESRFTKTAL